MKYKFTEIDMIEDVDDAEYIEKMAAKQMKQFKNNQKVNSERKKKEIRKKRKQKENLKVSAFYVDSK
jgi:hypothetical protein